MFQHADRAQQTFSSENEPSLHIAIPALEALHSAWSKRIEREKYSEFLDAIQAGIDKLNKYYERTEDSTAYIMSMSMFQL
jgi:hypothetical protein